MEGEGGVSNMTVSPTARPAFDAGLHRFYYGALHVLASASRSGKVAPGLYGELPPSARLSFCWRSLIVSIETPAKGRGGVQQNDSLADGW